MCEKYKPCNDVLRDVEAAMQVLKNSASEIDFNALSPLDIESFRALQEIGLVVRNKGEKCFKPSDGMEVLRRNSRFFRLSSRPR